MINKIFVWAIGIIIITTIQFISFFQQKFISTCWGQQKPLGSIGVAVSHFPRGSVVLPVSVTEEMIKRGDPILVSYVLREKTPIKVFLIDTHGNLVKEVTQTMPGVGTLEEKQIGKWSEVKSSGDYTIAYVVPVTKEFVFEEVGVYNRLRNLVTEMNVTPEKGEKFIISYKLNKTSNVTCQSLHPGTKKAVWTSDEGERPEGQLQQCKEWDATRHEQGKYYVQVIAHLPNDPKSGSDQKTKLVEVVK